MKVYAIFLVILGHSPIWQGFPKQFDYSFSMPVFFALYGMTYNIESHAAKGFLTLGFFKKRFLRLMAPAIVWAVGYSIVAPFDDSSFRPYNLLYIAYFSQASLKHAGSLTSLWFMPCMFLAVLLTEIAISFIHKSFKEQRRIYPLLAIIILFASITFLLPRFRHGYLWCVNLVPLATAMIMVGFLVRQIFDCVLNRILNYRITVLLTFVVSFIFLCIVSWINWSFVTGRNADMASASFGNPLLYLLGAILGIIMTTAISIFTSSACLHPILAFAGANTYGIFLVHKPLIISLGRFLASYGIGNLFTAFLSALVVLLISGVITYILVKIYPPLVGSSV